MRAERGKKDHHVFCLTVILSSLMGLVLPLFLAVYPMGASSLPVTADEVIRQMLQTQRNLRNFIARGRLKLEVGGMTLGSFPLTLYATRPSLAVMEVMGVKVKPDYPLIFPDPEELATQKYQLSLYGEDQVRGKPCWVIDAVPRKAETSFDHLRFWITQEENLIVRSEMRFVKGETVTLEATYRQVEEGCWVPVELIGRGWNRIGVNLPGGRLLHLKLPWVDRYLVYRAEFSKYEVNTGLSDALFARKGAY